MTRAYTVNEALARFVANTPALVTIESDDTWRLPAPRALKLLDNRASRIPTQHLTLAHLDDILYGELVPGPSGLPAVRPLGQLLSDDGVDVVVHRDGFIDYVKKAYPEEFEDVELVYVGRSDDLRDDTDLIDDYLCEQTPSTTSRYETLTDVISDTAYDNAVEDARRIRDDAEADLQTLGFTEAGYDIADIRDELRGLDDVHGYVDQYAKNTPPVFVQSLLAVENSPSHFSIDEPDVPDHLDETTQKVMLKMWAMSTLSNRGIRPTDHNVAMLLNALDEVGSYQYVELTVFGRVALAPFVDRAYEQTLTELDRPYLWVGDTHEGYGIETERLEGSVTVPQANVHHHRHDHGHSLVEINGFIESAFDVLDVTFHQAAATTCVVTDED